MSALITLATCAAPGWIFLSGCSSSPDLYPPSMNATDGNVPFFRSSKYASNGSILSLCCDPNGWNSPIKAVFGSLR